MVTAMIQDWTGTRGAAGSLKPIHPTGAIQMVSWTFHVGESREYKAMFSCFGKLDVGDGIGDGEGYGTGDGSGWGDDTEYENSNYDGEHGGWGDGRFYGDGEGGNFSFV